MPIDRKPQVRLAWRPVTRAEVMLAQGVEMRGDTIAGRRVVEYVCEWSLYEANGERVCVSSPRGFRNKKEALNSVSVAASLLLNFADSNLDYSTPRIAGPGKKPELP